MLYQGDCVETMRTLPDNSVDSIVTDPPYELGFMNKSWDSTGIANNVEMWKECLRVLKPGGHLLSFGGTRTYHRMACAIEDAGFEIRDQMQWLYGSGFPKGMDISKSIDKKFGVEREVVGTCKRAGKSSGILGAFEGNNKVTAPESDEAKQWEGWGTCLKPAHEPICMARKPVSEKTIAENVLKWGTGGLNIDACRIETQEEITNHARSAESAKSKGKYGDSKGQETHQTIGQAYGRFPANIILDEKAGQLLDEQAPKTGAFAPVKSGYNGESNGIYGDFASKGDDGASFHADGLHGASRFFYCPKASKSERGERNSHPTVKPIKLIEYLVKLVTPQNSVVLDPFMGSGTTGIAANNLGHKFIGIELDKGYFEIAEKRIGTDSGVKQINMLDAI